jgi:hypothetical protein
MHNRFKEEVWFVKHMKSNYCLGKAYMAAQAMHTNEMKLHTNRLTVLRNTTDPHQLYQQIKSGDDAKLHAMDILVYAENVELCQQAYHFPDYFPQDKRPLTENPQQAMRLIQSLSSEKQGGFQQLESFSGCYEQNELELYFKILREKISQYHASITSIYPVSLVLSSGQHALTVGYNRSTKKWTIVNRSAVNIHQTDKEIACSVLSAFSTNGIAIFHTAVTCIGSEYTLLKTQVNQWQQNSKMKAIHRITAQKTQQLDSHHANWLFIAARHNQVATAKILLENGANPNQIYHQRTHALAAAIQNHNPVMLKLLIDFQADINQCLLDSHHQTITPTLLAKRGGQKEIITLLTGISPTTTEVQSIIIDPTAFDTFEHEDIINQAQPFALDINGQAITDFTIFKITGDNNEKLETLAATSTQTLTLGQLGAAPDYFNLATGSIANYTKNQTQQETINNFAQGFNTLFLEKINATMATIDEIDRAGGNDYTQTVKLVGCCGFKYTTLLEQNFDHFFPDSWLAYRAGHTLALRFAKLANELYQIGSHTLASRYIHTAYAVDAYALHFATDNFSAGHMQPPRRGLIKLANSAVGCGLVNDQHNEAGQYGIQVKNARGDVWTAYGDGHLADPANEKNFQLAIEASQESIKEIYQTYKTGEIPTKFFMQQIIPVPVDNTDTLEGQLNLEKPYHPDPTKIHLQPNRPLFVEDEKEVIYVRSNRNDRRCNTYEVLTPFHAAIMEVKYRLKPSGSIATKLSSHQHPHAEEKCSGQSSTTNKPEFLNFRSGMERIINKYKNYTHLAFFRGSLDSKKAASTFSIDNNISTSEYVNILIVFIEKNLTATDLLKDMRILLNVCIRSVGGHDKMNTLEDMQCYLESQSAIFHPSRASVKTTSQPKKHWYSC